MNQNNLKEIKSELNELYEEFNRVDSEIELLSDQFLDMYFQIMGWFAAVSVVILLATLIFEIRAHFKYKGKTYSDEKTPSILDIIFHTAQMLLLAGVIISLICAMVFTVKNMNISPSTFDINNSIQTKENELFEAQNVYQNIVKESITEKYIIPEETAKFNFIYSNDRTVIVESEVQYNDVEEYKRYTLNILIENGEPQIMTNGDVTKEYIKKITK